jgi:hypothetical protein
VPHRKRQAPIWHEPARDYYVAWTSASSQERHRHLQAEPVKLQQSGGFRQWRYLYKSNLGSIASTSPHNTSIEYRSRNNCGWVSGLTESEPYFQVYSNFQVVLVHQIASRWVSFICLYLPQVRSKHYFSQVSLVRPGTSVQQPVPSVPTTARRENSSLVVNRPTRSSAQSVSTLCAQGVVTPSSVPSVLTLVISRGDLSMLQRKRELSVLWVSIFSCWDQILNVGSRYTMRLTTSLSARTPSLRVPLYWSMLLLSVSGTNLTWVYPPSMCIWRLLNGP